MMQEPATLRFVVLEHRNADGVHWDLMIETSPGAPLRTWRLQHDLRFHAGPICATPIGDHRRAYLEFEGQLSEGRGSVRRVERGTARWLEDKSDQVSIGLEGDMVRGVFRIRPSAAAGWVLGRE